MRNRPPTLVLVLAAALLAPLASSHPDVGTPKRFCESHAEHILHDYAGWGQFQSASLLGSGEDTGAGAPPRTYDGSVHDDDRTQDPYCSYPWTPWDGHNEFGWGGATLTAGNGYGFSEDCLGEFAHHDIYPIVYVEDAVVGGVQFYVAVDWGPEGSDAAFPCGDGIVEPCTEAEPTPGCNPRDEWMVGFGAEKVTFLPGASGAYLVFVQGTAGHIRST